VEAAARYLVQRHGIELRQLRAFAMGKVALAAGEKPSPEAFAKARRVDIRLLAPWSSWEDAQAPIDQTASAQPSTGDPSAEAVAAAPKSIKGDEFKPSRAPARCTREGTVYVNLQRRTSRLARATIATSSRMPCPARRCSRS